MDADDSAGRSIVLDRKHFDECWSGGVHDARRPMRSRGNGGDAPARAIHRSAGLFGFEGVEPLASPRVIPGVCGAPEAQITAGDHVSSIRTA